jgi:DNA-binding Xre family transcriptional regulator
MKMIGREPNTIAFVKMLLSKNYTNKQVSMITCMTESSVSKIANKKIYKDVLETSYQTNICLENNKRVLDTILSGKEIAGHGHLSDDDRYYIKLIKMCGGKYQDVREMYYDRPIDELRPAWDYANQLDYHGFNPMLLGITEEDFFNFITQAEICYSALE